MSVVASVLAIIAGLFAVWRQYFVKSPEQLAEEARRKQLELDRALAAAMEKAKHEKDPADLSRIVNSGGK